jgi:hypothetical protein
MYFQHLMLIPKSSVLDQLFCVPKQINVLHFMLPKSYEEVYVNFFFLCSLNNDMALSFAYFELVYF